METKHQKKKLLFIGDSITDAFRREEEVNESFQLGNGYVFLIAAHLRHFYPELDLEFVNRGISGQVLGQIASRWESDVIAQQPDTLTLLAGVNDLIRREKGMNAYAEPEEFEDCLRTLLQQTIKAKPQTRMVLMEPFVLDTGMVQAGWRETFVPYQAAVKRQAEAFNTDYIPLQSIFDQACEQAPPSHWSYDGVHPNPGGFMRIASAWLEHMNPDLDFIKKEGIPNLAANDLRG